MFSPDEFFSALDKKGINTLEALDTFLGQTVNVTARAELVKAFDAARAGLAKAQQAEQAKVLVAQKAITDFDASVAAEAARV